MKPLIRFGRRISLPSTFQIAQELRTFSVDDFVRRLQVRTAKDVA